MEPNVLLAEIQGMLGSAKDNFRDVRADLIFSDSDVAEEVRVIDTLTYIVDHWDDFAAYVSGGE